jgi:hypothetical protein
MGGGDCNINKNINKKTTIKSNNGINNMSTLHA